jgi:hypothetical protein
MSAEAIGVPPQFLTPLKADVLIVPLPPTAPGGRAGTQKFYYRPYSIAAQLLACMDLCTIPGEMLQYMNAAVDAGVRTRALFVRSMIIFWARFCRWLRRRPGPLWLGTES